MTISELFRRRHETPAAPLGPFHCYTYAEAGRWDYAYGAVHLEDCRTFAYRSEMPWRIVNRAGKVIEHGDGQATVIER